MSQIASESEAPLVGVPTTTQQVTAQTVTGLGNLIKLLPSGTFFLFVFLNPALTNNGECRTSNKYLSGIFLALCGFACCFSWFTDSYIDKNGKVQYGIVTKKGLYPITDSDPSSANLKAFKLCLGDFAHATLSIIVFAIVALLDPNTVDCFYPNFKTTQKQLIMALPPVVGAVASSAFVMFPNSRHGLGFPPRQPSEKPKTGSSL
ncbi:Dmp2 [Thalictrum thalictroides]|uniref:Dmp2 n=1 Tax=Thalictrum thalictroides TaxID=46969 RepID=A0A7J6UTJ1_THATH|nr:Dmp2 [Thalictrum thalictroides]